MSISGWTMADTAPTEPDGEDTPLVHWRLPVLRTDVWGEAAQSSLLDEMSGLAPDWDGGGASPISGAATVNARTLLHAFWSIGYAPDYILPNAAGTIQFEWDAQFGSAHLEIGNASFGFYTDPGAGESFLRDGPFEVMDVEEIASALATIDPRPVGESLARWDNALGFARRYAPRAA